MAAIGLSLSAGVASAASPRSESAEPPFCEQDRCVFGFAFCENAEWQWTGCNMNAWGICSQYNCDKET